MERMKQRSDAHGAQLSKELTTYKVYVSPGMSAAELGKYECLNTSVGAGVFPSPWWGNFSGPCCRRK